MIIRFVRSIECDVHTFTEEGEFCSTHRFIRGQVYLVGEHSPCGDDTSVMEFVFGYAEIPDDFWAQYEGVMLLWPYENGGSEN